MRAAARATTATVSQALLALVSTRTSSESSVPSRRTTSPKWGESSGIRPSTSPTWLGYTFTPRMMSMSSLRPTIGPMRTSVRPHEHGAEREAADVARPVPDQRERRLRERRHDEHALLAFGELLARIRVDDLGEEVILVHVRAGSLLDALARHAGTDDLREPVDVRAADAQASVDLVTHTLGPRLGSDDGEAQAVVVGRSGRAPRARCKREGVAGRATDDIRPQILDQRHLALGHSSGDRYHVSPSARRRRGSLARP